MKIGDTVKVKGQDIIGTIVNMYDNTVIISDNNAIKLKMRGLELEYNKNQVYLKRDKKNNKLKRKVKK